MDDLPQAVYGWELFEKSDIPWSQDLRLDEALYYFPPNEPVGKVPCFVCLGTGWEIFEVCVPCKGQGHVYVGLI